MIKMQDATKTGTELFDLLKRQRQYYLELRRLSKQQRALIEADQPEELIRILGQRQKIVDAIAKIHKQSEPYRKEWQELKELIPTQLKQSIQSLLAELQQMLDEILEDDKQDSEKLSAAKRQVHQQIDSAQKVKSVMNSYAKNQTNRNSSGNNFQFTG